MALVVGIDLGTTNTCVAIFQNGEIKILSEDYHRTIPSCVYYHTSGTISVGHEAVANSTIQPHRAIFDIKRIIGRSFRDLHEEAQQYSPITFNCNEKNEIELILDNDKKLKPVEVCAEILRKIKQVAGNALGVDVENAVITVPAYFTNAQRQITKEAAILAGFNVLKLLNEPTAAVLAFGQQRSSSDDRTVLIYDLGGGTFDVSIIHIVNNRGTVLATAGDAHLGGRDFDKNLLAYIIHKIQEDYQLKIQDLSLFQRKRAIRRLRSESELAKIKLSQVLKDELSLDEFHGCNIKVAINRQLFEVLNQSLFARTMAIVQQTLDAVPLAKTQINDVILVGGSTRIPKIRQMLLEFFNGQEPNRSVNPDEAVAIGAALQAALLSSNPTQQGSMMALTDATPHSLGVEVADSQTMNILLKKHTKIPATYQKTYYTINDYQQAMAIRIFEGEDPHAKNNTLLGEFLIDGITARLSGEVAVEIKFHVDLDGILQVHASETSRNNTKKLNIHLLSGKK